MTLRAALRLSGWVSPAAGALTVGLLLVLNATLWRESPPVDAFGFLAPARLIETVVPLAFAIQVAFALSPEDEAPLELLLACPQRPAVQIVRRVGPALALHGTIGLLGSAALALLLDPAPAIWELVARWLAPAIFFGGIALLIAVRSRKGILGALIVLLLWGGLLLGGDALQAQAAFLEPLHAYLQPAGLAAGAYLRNRIALLLVGLGAGTLALTRLDEEELLGVARPGGMEDLLVDRQNLLLLASALALTALSSGKWSLGWAAWLAPFLLLRFTRRQPGGGGLLLAYLGLAIGLAAAWRAMLLDLVGLAFLVFAILYGLYLLVPYLVDRLLVVGRDLGARPSSALVFPCAWAGLGWLHQTLGPAAEFVGAPAVSQVGFLPLLQTVSLGGSLAITFVIGWSAAALNWAWEQRAEPRRALRGLLPPVGALALLLIWGAARLAAAPTGGTVLQAAGLVLPERVAADYLAESRRAAAGGAELVLWPEYAVIVDPEDEADFIRRAALLARDESIYLAATIAVRPAAGETLSQNKMLLFQPDGELAWEYYKSNPVPGLEPAVRGDGRLPVLDSPFGRLSAAICYDLDFPTLIRQAGPAGVALMLGAANDLYPAFDPYHARASVLRAVENGFTLLRVADRGLSLAVDPWGRPLAALDYYETTGTRHFRLELPVRRSATVYGVTGDLVGWLSLLGLAVLVVKGERA